jgi:CheY-like chemotaxis protein
LSRRSGTLQLTTPVESGEIVFRAGKVVAAFRTNAPGSVGDGLLEVGVVAPTTYQEMLAAQRAGKRGPELFTSFNIDAAALTGALEALLKRLIFGMFEWQEGTFSFVLEDAPDVWRGFSLDAARVVLESGLNPQYLAIEGARIRDEKQKEDSLETFLNRDKAKAAVAAEPTVNLKQIAAKLRTGEGLGEDDIMQGTFSAETSFASAAEPAPPEPPPPREEKVIPFPAERVRREAAPVVAAPAGLTPKSGAEAVVRQAAVAVSEPAAAVAAAPSALAGSSWRLLAVDDDPLMTRHVQNAMSASFAEVLTADTVTEALAAVERDAERLIVATDLIIARSDGRGILGGVEILERIRQRFPALPVILFTDYQNEEAEARARSMGVTAILQKPRKAQLQSSKDAGPLNQFLASLTSALQDVIGAAPAETRANAAPAPTVELRSVPAPAAAVPAAPQPAAAAAPAPVRAGSRDLGREIADEIEDLGAPMEEELPPAVLSAGEMSTLRSMLAELIDPSNRDTITLLVLRFASHIVERASLFLATRRVYVGLGGFSVEEDSDRFVGRVRRIQVPVEVDSVFAQVSRFRAIIRAPLKPIDGNKRLIEGLGGDFPKDPIVAAPLISGERVAAILYGDNPSGKPLGSTDSLEIFLQQAGLAMDRALLERKLEDSRKKPGSE